MTIDFANALKSVTSKRVSHVTMTAFAAQNISPSDPLVAVALFELAFSAKETAVGFAAERFGEEVGQKLRASIESMFVATAQHCQDTQDSMSAVVRALYREKAKP